MNKICTKCKTQKPIQDFPIANKRVDGHSSWCKKCQYDNQKRWKARNKDKFQEYMCRYRINNPDKIKKSNKKYRLNHPEKIRELVAIGNAKRRSTAKGKLNHSMRSGIVRSIRTNKNGRRWEDLVGYSVSDLKRHLEKHFLSGMTWENYGLHGWHIDHSIPISAFNFKNTEHIDFKKCWALDNLRPMWASDNIVKSDRLDYPFQPSLLLQ